MKTHRVQFLVVPLLMVSLLALPCATLAQVPMKPGLSKPKLPSIATCATGTLAIDTVCNYNPTAVAKFKGSTAMKVGANGYVTEGTLAADQDLFFASGKSVKLRAGSSVTFAFDYLSYGSKLAGHQRLAWGPSRIAEWKDDTAITFSTTPRWVMRGTLRNPTQLPHAGAPCCSSAICTINFPNDIEINCSGLALTCTAAVTWPADACTTCVSRGETAAKECCCN